MGKLLKVLTVFLFLFSVAAFVMGLANFNKRELLVGRTHELEDSYKQLAATLEAKAPTFDGVATHVAWDIDEVTERPADSPTTDDFWDSYEDVLETSVTEMVLLRNKEEQLRTYYQMDPATGKPKKDFQGKPVTTGKGTMHDLLEETVARAKDQHALLNRTRQQLIAVREKLDDVAAMLNDEKQQRRANLATIAQLNATIKELNDAIAARDNQIAQLNREKADLEDQIADLNSNLAQKDQELQDEKAENARLREEIQRLQVDGGDSSKRGGGGGAASGNGASGGLTAGVKGVVRAVNAQWSYVLVELTPEAAAEVAPGGTFEPVEMMVRRKAPDGSDVIVTRVQIQTPPNARNIAVADNMYGWEQVPVEVGDELVY